jgi:hypothetical protein
MMWINYRFTINIFIKLTIIYLFNNCENWNVISNKINKNYIKFNISMVSSNFKKILFVLGKNKIILIKNNK